MFYGVFTKNNIVCIKISIMCTKRSASIIFYEIICMKDCLNMGKAVPVPNRFPMREYVY